MGDIGLGGSNILVGIDGAGSNHATEAESKTTKTNNPRVRDHDTVNEAAGDHLVGREADDTNTETKVSETLVQVLALVGRDSSFSRLAVEHGLDGNPGAADDGTADQHLLDQLAAVGLCGILALLVTAGGALKAGNEFGLRIRSEGERGGLGCEEGVVLGGLVESAGGG